MRDVMTKCVKTNKLFEPVRKCSTRHRRPPFFWVNGPQLGLGAYHVDIGAVWVP